MTSPLSQRHASADSVQLRYRTTAGPRGGSRLGFDSTVLSRRNGLAFSSQTTYEAWQRVGKHLFLVTDSSAWWLGDWLIYGERTFPDRYKQAIAETSLEYQTLRNYAWVSRKFSLSRRRDKLSFQHHAEVAGLPECEQDAWLSEAERHQWSRNQLRRQIRASRRPAAEGGTPSAIVLQVPPDRAQAWRAAADLADCSLENWMTTVLDDAARTRLPGTVASTAADAVNATADSVPVLSLRS